MKFITKELNKYITVTFSQQAKTFLTTGSATMYFGKNVNKFCGGIGIQILKYVWNSSYNVCSEVISECLGSEEN